MASASGKLKVAYAEACSEYRCKQNSKVVRLIDTGHGCRVADLGFALLGGKGSLAAVKALQTCDELEELVLADCCISDGAVASLVSGLSLLSARLRVIDLSGNPIKSAGGMMLLELVKKKRSLCELHLARTDISDDLRNIIQRRLLSSQPLASFEVQPKHCDVLEKRVADRLYERLLCLQQQTDAARQRNEFFDIPMAKEQSGQEQKQQKKASGLRDALHLRQPARSTEVPSLATHQHPLLLSTDPSADINAHCRRLNVSFKAYDQHRHSCADLQCCRVGTPPVLNQPTVVPDLLSFTHVPATDLVFQLLPFFDEGVLRSLISPSRVSESCGCYSVRFSINGTWRYLLVDDRHIVGTNNSTVPPLWALLLHKAATMLQKAYFVTSSDTVFASFLYASWSAGVSVDTGVPSRGDASAKEAAWGLFERTSECVAGGGWLGFAGGGKRAWAENAASGEDEVFVIVRARRIGSRRLVVLANPRSKKRSPGTGLHSTHWRPSTAKSSERVKAICKHAQDSDPADTSIRPSTSDHVARPSARLGSLSGEHTNATPATPSGRRGIPAAWLHESDVILKDPKVFFFASTHESRSTAQSGLLRAVEASDWFVMEFDAFLEAFSRFSVVWPRVYDGDDVNGKSEWMKISFTAVSDRVESLQRLWEVDPDGSAGQGETAFDLLLVRETAMSQRLRADVNGVPAEEAELQLNQNDGFGIRLDLFAGRQPPLSCAKLHSNLVSTAQVPFGCPFAHLRASPPLGYTRCYLSVQIDPSLIYQSGASVPQNEANIHIGAAAPGAFVPSGRYSSHLAVCQSLTTGGREAAAQKRNTPSQPPCVINFHVLTRRARLKPVAGRQSWAVYRSGPYTVPVVGEFSRCDENAAQFKISVAGRPSSYKPSRCSSADGGSSGVVQESGPSEPCTRVKVDESASDDVSSDAESDDDGDRAPASAVRTVIVLTATHATVQLGVGFLVCYASSRLFSCIADSIVIASCPHTMPRPEEAGGEVAYKCELEVLLPPGDYVVVPTLSPEGVQNVRVSAAVAVHSTSLQTGAALQLTGFPALPSTRCSINRTIPVKGSVPLYRITSCLPAAELFLRLSCTPVLGPISFSVFLSSCLLGGPLERARSLDIPLATTPALPFSTSIAFTSPSGGALTSLGIAYSDSDHPLELAFDVVANQCPGGAFCAFEFFVSSTTPDLIQNLAVSVISEDSSDRKI